MDGDISLCLALRRRRRGKQLNGELALYASRRRFGPGPESSVKGCAAGWGVRFLRPSLSANFGSGSKATADGPHHGRAAGRGV